MALNTATSMGVINALADGKSYTFPTPYLGLLTVMPDASGNNGAELNYPGYFRINLTEKGINGKTFLSEATTEDGTGDDEGTKIAYVKNEDLIYFTDVDDVEEDYSEQVVGVALYSSKTATAPYLWGELPADSEVIVRKKSVPMIKLNNLRLIAK